MRLNGLESPEGEEWEVEIHGDKKKLDHLAFTQIRKQSVDPYNRLRSIAEDAQFVEMVHELFPKFPLVGE